MCVNLGREGASGEAWCVKPAAGGKIGFLGTFPALWDVLTPENGFSAPKSVYPGGQAPTFATGGSPTKMRKSEKTSGAKKMFFNFSLCSGPGTPAPGANLAEIRKGAFFAILGQRIEFKEKNILLLYI